MNAVITGASRGIGKAIAVKLAGLGYNLALCSRNPDELEDFANELRNEAGVKVLCRATDCSIKSEVYAFAGEARDFFGDVDVLVNNVGVFMPGDILGEEDEAFENQLQVNLNTAYYLCKFFGRMMKERASGHIFNICSVAGKQIVTNAGSYSVTKAALLSLNDVFRETLSGYNVKVTAILPGATFSSSWAGTEIPQERFVQPGDIAQTLEGILKLSSAANVDEITVKPIRF